MLLPKTICIWSQQQQVWSFRGGKSTKNWKRRLKTQLNVIKMERQLPPSERWFPCLCQIELHKYFFKNFSCTVLEFSKKFNFVENCDAFTSEYLTQELKRYQNFPPYPIPIFQVAELVKLGKSGFIKSEIF